METITGLQNLIFGAADFTGFLSLDFIGTARKVRRNVMGPMADIGRTQWQAPSPPSIPTDRRPSIPTVRDMVDLIRLVDTFSTLHTRKSCN